MDLMQEGVNKVQFGFINNDKKSILDGLVKISDGNNKFSDKKTLSKHYNHKTSIALSASKRIRANTTIVELNLDENAFTKAVEGYGDILNACAKCHSIVRDTR